MEDEERQNALKLWKEKIGGLECKARRHTLDKVYTSLQDRDDDDDEYEQWLPVRPRKLRSFSGSKGVKSGEVDFSTWWLHALAIAKYDDLWESEKKRILCEKFLGLALEVFCMTPKSTVSELLVLLEQNFGDVTDGFELYSQFRAAIQGMQRYLHQFHFLAMKAGSLRVNVLMMCCSVTAWGRSSQKQLQWMTLCSFWEQKGVRTIRRNSGWRPRMPMWWLPVEKGSPLRWQHRRRLFEISLCLSHYKYRPRQQVTWPCNLTTCVIVQGAHASQLPIPKDKQEDCVVVASGVGNQLVSHPGLDSVSTVDRTAIFSLHRAMPGILT